MLIEGNTFTDIAAEGADLKEGVDSGVLRDNVFDNAGFSGENSADSAIDVKANGWLVEGNTIRNPTSAALDGIQTHSVYEGYGTANVIRGNVIEGSWPGFGIGTYPHLDNVVACDNRAPGAALGLVGDGERAIPCDSTPPPDPECDALPRIATVTLAPGDQAPDFTIPDQHDNATSLTSFKGRKVLVYFYPKADTPGCTKQACGLNDVLGDLGDTAVLGISPDKPSKQLKFAEKYGLTRRSSAMPSGRARTTGSFTEPDRHRPADPRQRPAPHPCGAVAALSRPPHGAWLRCDRCGRAGGAWHLARP